MKIILTGATGYVGEGVMLELLRTPQVEKVLSVGRRSVRIDEYPLADAEKAKLEEYIRTLGFKHAFAYRPALMRWAKGQRGTKMQRMQYAYICFYPLMRLCGLANNMTEVAHSMLACTRDGYPHYAINHRDITKLAKQL